MNRFQMLAIGSVVLSMALLGANQAVQDSDFSHETYRTWTDSTGRYTTEAVMIKYGNGKVHLKKRDGRVSEVPLVRLSRDDQSYVHKRVAALRRVAKSTTSVRNRQTAASTNNWPGWRGPYRDGKSPDTGLLKQWPEAGPLLLWKNTKIGKGFSSVAVADGMIYTMGDVGTNLVLFALDANGHIRWQVKHDAAYSRSHPGSRATPTYDEGNLYVTSGNGRIGCYDSNTGRLKWAHTMQEFGGRIPEWGFAESVLIYKDLAIVTPGGPRCIVALDKKTGRPAWTTEGYDAGAQYGSCYAFTYHGVPQVVTGTKKGLVCLHPDRGQVAWTNSFSSGNTANCPTPAYSDGYLFWANGYGKGGICLQLEGRGRNVIARQAWTTRDIVCHHGGYIIQDGYIYGNHNSGWVCLDLRTGEKRWQSRGVGKGSLCFADGMLYLFSENDGKAALATCSPDAMEIRGMVQVEGSGPSWAHPVVVGGRLYLRYDTNLYCFKVKADG